MGSSPVLTTLNPPTGIRGAPAPAPAPVPTEAAAVPLPAAATPVPAAAAPAFAVTAAADAPLAAADAADVAANTASSSAASATDIFCPAELGPTGRFHLLSSGGRVSMNGGWGGYTGECNFCSRII